MERRQGQRADRRDLDFKIRSGALRCGGGERRPGQNGGPERGRLFHFGQRDLRFRIQGSEQVEIGEVFPEAALDKDGAGTVESCHVQGKRGLDSERDIQDRHRCIKIVKKRRNHLTYEDLFQVDFFSSVDDTRSGFSAVCP